MNQKTDQMAWKEYQKWIQDRRVSKEFGEQMRRIAENPKEITERFGGELPFGTGGMRGILGVGTRYMNRFTVMRATQGYALFIRDCGDEACRRGVVIAYDNRYFSKEFAMAAAGVLLANGISVALFPSLRPTPELSFAVRSRKAFGGIMITASHNPPIYNGYKLYDENGCQLIPEKMQPIIHQIAGITDPLRVETVPQEQLMQKITWLGEETDEAYLQAVLGVQLHAEIKKSDLRVVYSPLHGTGNVPVRSVLERLEYSLIPVEEQCEPDPAFSNTKNPNPESEDAYDLALTYARKTAADLVLTTDPDCDRLGCAVRHNGDYVRMTGNQSALVLLYYILTQRKQQGTLPQNAFVCNTIVTSDIGDRLCAAWGIGVEKTLTGFKYIGDRIDRHEKGDGMPFLFGYEESYGCLISAAVRDKDAVQASVLLCECAAFYQREGKSLIDVLHALYEKYGYVKDALEAITLQESEGQRRMTSFMEGLRIKKEWKVGNDEVIRVEDYLTEEMQQKGFPKENVLKLFFENGSWIAVRPSGTEPKCKIYYNVYGAHQADAEKRFEEWSSSMARLLSEI